MEGILRFFLFYIFITIYLYKYYLLFYDNAKVKLLGEGADDAGGVFDAIVTEMCDELLNGSVQLLVPTPNHISDVGYNKDRFLFNPRLTSEEHLQLFKFLGTFLRESKKINVVIF